MHQAAERYFHAVLLVFTGYKPKSHDLEALAKQTAPFHEILEGALPRTEPDDEHHFDLLRRAYIDARYSRSYRVTSEELAVLRGHVLDLAARVRTACADKLRALSPSGEIPKLAAVPDITECVELPDLPDLSDARAVEAWRDAVAQMSFERGRREGLLEGRTAGLEEGLQLGVERGRNEGLVEGRTAGLEEGIQLGRTAERAGAIVDVLKRRGIAVSDEQAERILTCRDEATIARWWECAWSITSLDEL